nr:Peptidase M12A domain containing protein [Haemonchus contortus]
MRLLLLMLFLVAVVNAGIFSKIKEVFSGEGSVGQKLKNATIITGQKLFKDTPLFKIRDWFRDLKDKVAKTLQLTKEQLKSLKERLKNWLPIKNDHVREMGDSVDEINENSHVIGDLYQGDVVLTVDQAKEIIEGIEEQASGVNRKKRQAFKDRRYPKTIWSEGVSYYFHSLATENRIMVFPEDGCWSFVGRLGGEQKLSLGSGCETPDIAAHEIGHALGFFHTMSRYDRDDYITVNTVNVKSPVGTVIQGRLLDFTKGFSVDGCKYAGVEIKTNKDQTLTGYRFCSPDAAGVTLQSFTNRVPIMTYNRLYQSKTVLEYRYGKYFASFPCRNNLFEPDNSVSGGSPVPAPLPPTTTTKGPVVVPVVPQGSKCLDESR